MLLVNSCVLFKWNESGFDSIGNGHAMFLYVVRVNLRVASEGDLSYVIITTGCY